jgi:hypothetical protein
MTPAEQNTTLRERRKQELIAGFTMAAIGFSLLLRFGVRPTGEVYGRPLWELPLLTTLLFGGLPLVFALLPKLLRREFGSDLLAGISIITSALLGEYLAGSLVVLMFSGGEANHPLAEESLKLGVWRIVPKPVEFPDLLALLDEVLNQPLDTVFRLVRQVEPQARTVLITGYGAELEPSLERLAREGADAAFRKPFDIDELADPARR